MNFATTVAQALLFFGFMHLLFVIATCCCILLVGVAAALWLSIQQGRRQPPADRPQAFADAMRQTARQPHPRMDLAAGIAAGSFGASQHVRGAPRRRGLSMDAVAEAEAAKAMPRIAAKMPGRPEWAVFNGQPGDFSDPDPRRAPAGGVRRPLGTVSLPESR